jgi:hypothetical protein
MSSYECVLCDACITAENDSWEHVIPNAIGGKKKIHNFICNSCNNSTGHRWDAELARQLNSLSLLLGITRERGMPPSQVFESTTGGKYTLHSDGRMTPEKPSYTESVMDNSVQISIVARDMREAEKILTGVKKKYPQINIEEHLDSADMKTQYMDGMLKFSLCFGGPDAGRSAVKSAVAVAINAGIPANSCDKAIEYLKNEDASPCFGYFYTRDLVNGRQEGSVLHCVAIQGDSEKKTLIGYVEFFGAQRVVMCLSENYCGEDIQSYYAIDPISGKEVSLDLDLDITVDEVKSAYEYKEIPDGSMQAAVGKVVQLALMNSFEREKYRVIHEAVEYAFKNCGAEYGQELSEEHMVKLNELLMEKMKPFILHNVRKPRQ